MISLDPPVQSIIQGNLFVQWILMDINVLVIFGIFSHRPKPVSSTQASAALLEEIIRTWGTLSDFIVIWNPFYEPDASTSLCYLSSFYNTFVVHSIRNLLSLLHTLTALLQLVKIYRDAPNRLPESIAFGSSKSQIYSLGSGDCHPLGSSALRSSSANKLGPCLLFHS